MSLAAALVSMLALEVAMLARFSTPEQALFCTRMIAGSGGAVCALVAGLGGYLFIRTGRRTHKEDCCDAGKS